MRSRPKLLRGWSYPITASEVQKLFPGVERTHWGWSPTRLRNWSPEERPCVLLRWTPHTAMPPSGVSFATVPSESRASVREWIKTAVAPEAQAWLRELENRSPVWRDGKHSVHWVWANLGSRNCPRDGHQSAVQGRPRIQIGAQNTGSFQWALRARSTALDYRFRRSNVGFDLAGGRLMTAPRRAVLRWTRSLVPGGPL